MELLQVYPQLLFVDCCSGQSKKAECFLQRADLILLLLPQSKELLRDIYQQTLPYHKNCLPILCGYRRFAEPTPEQIGRYYRLSDRPVGLLPAKELFSQASLSEDRSELVRYTGRLIRLRIEAL